MKFNTKKYWSKPTTVSKLPIIFIVGVPRSGTTLLQCIIGAHSKLISCDRETAMFNTHNNPIFNLGIPQETIDSANDCIHLFEIMVKHLLKNEGDKQFVSKCPSDIRRLPIILKHFPNAKVIHIIRDGRDCFQSAKSHPYIPQNRNALLFSAYWRSCIQMGIKYILDPRVLTVTYEHMVNNPEPLLTIAMPFLGLKPEKSQLSQNKRKQDQRSGTEFHAKLKEPISNSSVGRWSNGLGVWEKKIFNLVADKQLKYFGYIK